MTTTLHGLCSVFQIAASCVYKHTWVLCSNVWSLMLTGERKSQTKIILKVQAMLEFRLNQKLPSQTLHRWFRPLWTEDCCSLQKTRYSITNIQIVANMSTWVSNFGVTGFYKQLTRSEKVYKCYLHLFSWPNSAFFGYGSVCLIAASNREFENTRLSVVFFENDGLPNNLLILPKITWQPPGVSDSQTVWLSAVYILVQLLPGSVELSFQPDPWVSKTWKHLCFQAAEVSGGHS